jgi:cytochrome b involved in lipid metabolism
MLLAKGARMSAKRYSAEEVSQHGTINDLWMVIHDKVYDVTSFADEHPGGVDTLLDQAGGDASVEFDAVGHSSAAQRMLEKYLVGTVAAGSVAGKRGHGTDIKTTISSSSVYVAAVVWVLSLAVLAVARSLGSE